MKQRRLRAARRFCRAALLAAALCLPPFFSPSGAQQCAAADTSPPVPARQEENLLGKRFTATRFFSGAVTREDAALMAETAAHAAAVQFALPYVAAIPEVALAARLAPSHSVPLNLFALTNAAIHTEPIIQSDSRKDSSVTVTIAVADAADGSSFASRARNALISPERLALYEKTALRELELDTIFRAFDAKGGGKTKQTREREAAATDAARETQALRMYREILPTFDGVWKKPETARNAMREALAIFPHSALARNALGDANLQLGLSQAAIEEQNKAVQIDPAFARAYHSRGAAHLAQGHSSLAEADFSESIRLSPHEGAYYRDRGVVRYLLGETKTMCEDFYQACLRGDCKKLQWGAEQNLCDPASLR